MFKYCVYASVYPGISFCPFTPYYQNQRTGAWFSLISVLLRVPRACMYEFHLWYVYTRVCIHLLFHFV